MKKSTVQLTLAGLEKLADAFVARHHQIKKLETEQIEAEALLINDARERRLLAEKGAQFFKSVHILGKTTAGVCVSFANKFGEISRNHEGLLQDFLGKELFSKTFESHLKFSATGPASIEQLKEALGEKGYESLLKFANVSEYLAPSQPFMELRSKLRHEVDEGTNEKIDQLVEHVQAKPSVKPVKS